MIKNLLKNPVVSYLLVFLITLPAVISVIRPGFYPMHDDFQVIRTFEMDKCFKDGQFPCRWVPDMGFGYGYPQFNYYAPLPYYIMELTHLVGFSFIDSVKLFIVLITLASAAGMYLFARYLWKNNLSALISTVLYVYLPFRAVDMYVRGAIPELTAMAVIPFLFLFAAKMAGGEKRSVFWFVISAAVLFLSHNIATLIVTPAVVLWTVYLTIRERNWPRVPWTIAGFAIAAGLSAFFIFPAWIEKGYVHINTLTSGYFNYLAHYVSLPQMLLSNHWGYGSSELGINDDIYLGVGIVQWISALVGVIAVFLTKKHKQIGSTLFLFVLGWVSLFLMHERSSFIWEKVEILSFIQFPWRILMLTGFLFAAVAGGIMIIPKTVLKWIAVGVVIVSVIVLYGNFFKPSQWLKTTDSQKLTGEAWTKSITASLYDYLPVSAKEGPDYEAKGEPVVKNGRADIVSGERGSNWQRWNVNVFSDEAEVELQLFYFPGFSVKVDGIASDIDYDNTYGLITVPLEKGEHQINARLENTPVRRAANIVSLLSLVPLGYIFFKRK